MKPTPQTSNDEQAMVAIYIIEGFNCTSRMAKERYEDISNRLGGHIGIATVIVDLSYSVAYDLSEAYRDRNGPGVWHYEIGHELGVYLFNNPYMPKEEFVQYAKMKTDEWMEKK